MLKKLMKKIRNRTVKLIYDLRLMGVPRLSFNYDKITEEGFFGQHGQDKFVAECLGFPKDGFFVDIGANDGITFSNTYYFEKELGWRGVAIEPLPKTFEKLKAVRSCQLINACVSDQKGDKQFLAVDGPEMLSGLVEKYDKAHLERIEEEIKTMGGGQETINVACFTLDEILNEQNISRVDYLSVDTEGGELDILKSVDLDSIFVDLISIENNYKTQMIRKYLEKYGYKLIAIADCDEIYKKVSI